MYIPGAYISETSEKGNRTKIGIFQALHCSAGFIISYGLGYLCGWRVTCFVMVIVTLSSSFLVLVLPESPYWLIENDRLEDAM